MYFVFAYRIILELSVKGETMGNPVKLQRYRYDEEKVTPAESTTPRPLLTPHETFRYHDNNSRKAAYYT